MSNRSHTALDKKYRTYANAYSSEVLLLTVRMFKIPPEDFCIGQTQGSYL